MRLFLLIFISLFAACFPREAISANQTVTASIAFETMLSVTKSNDISIGKVKALQSGVYTVSTDGQITAQDGGVILGGTWKAGSMTIAGSDTQAISISAENYTADKGVTPSAATCAYDGGASSPCSQTNLSAPGSGKQLLIGITVAADGTQEIGTTASPTFDIVVNYN